ncbi:hypothetical protein OMAG_002723 [Candidatus Omnitrophus magneticus]|uniref:Uncharacterized protein n=1 Tax=Candidatus Omnitrophus magneticus TaxID=1609969 RepID=A0A0F0CN27_9BACT|nr:hypothetical protein OMAG_002723 [Candidatus Omnitrophus magneticus]
MLSPKLRSLKVKGTSSYVILPRAEASISKSILNPLPVKPRTTLISKQRRSIKKPLIGSFISLFIIIWLRVVANLLIKSRLFSQFFIPDPSI